jgi:hemoglobin
MFRADPGPARTHYVKPEDQMTTAAPGADAEAVARAIQLFLEKMTSDEFLSWAFEGVDAADVQRHARAFVIAALGGPDLYIGRNMRDVHSRFLLTDAHFDRAVEHLLASFTGVGMAGSLTVTLAARLEPLRRQIVSD